MARDSLEPPADLPEGLVYCNDDGPGIRRRKTAKGYDYIDDRGERVTAAATLDRIEKLVIRRLDQRLDCSTARLPHPGDRPRRQGPQAIPLSRTTGAPTATKASTAVSPPSAAPFRPCANASTPTCASAACPAKRCWRPLVSLLEQTLIRVGNDEYAKTNKSFGLTTLRDRHAKLNSAGGRFEFVGKSGKTHSTAFHDRRLARIVKACQDLRGQRLFQYQDETGEIRPVTSGDVNDYLRAATGQGLHRQDLPHLGRNRRSRPHPLHARRHYRHQGHRHRLREGCRPPPRQHAGGVPQGLHPPSRDPGL